MSSPKPEAHAQAGRDLSARLADLASHDLLRVRKLPSTARDLTSNDMLGLATRTEVRDALIDALLDGVPHGGMASRLLRGEHPAWGAFEARFAAWQRQPAALVFTSGWAANTSLLAALCEPSDLIVSDALNHASLIDGARLAHARRVIVAHNDPDAVAQALAAHTGGQAYVVLESVYSMDGDLTDLHAFAHVCRHYGAKLILDEAHATGLFGSAGQGRAADLALDDVVIARLHTFGKALGLAGAAVVGSQALIDWLYNRARGFVFSTALPPFLAAGLQKAIDLVIAEPNLRKKPVAYGALLRAQLKGHAHTDPSASHIVPVVTGSAESALALSAHLERCGWDARAVRPPTVPEGTSRVRLVMHAHLNTSDLTQLASDIRTGLAP